LISVQSCSGFRPDICIKEWCQIVGRIFCPCDHAAHVAPQLKNQNSFTAMNLFFYPSVPSLRAQTRRPIKSGWIVDLLLLPYGPNSNGLLCTRQRRLCCCPPLTGAAAILRRFVLSPSHSGHDHELRTAAGRCALLSPRLPEFPRVLARCSTSFFFLVNRLTVSL